MNTETVVLEKARQWAPHLLAGALGGLAASVPMAFVMMGLNRYLPVSRRSWPEKLRPLPPKEIVVETAIRANVEEAVQPGQRWDAATWIGHLGYGAATASLYPLATRPLPLPYLARGMLFALGVWAGSYLGWLPALGILPPATRQTPRRNAVMILSHLSWGSLLALFTRLFEQRWDDRNAARPKTGKRRFRR